MRAPSPDRHVLEPRATKEEWVLLLSGCQDLPRRDVEDLELAGSEGEERGHRSEGARCCYLEGGGGVLLL